jgi:hypothetical protein
MKRPSFLEGAGVALVLAAVAGMTLTALSPPWSMQAVLYPLIAAISFAYLIYLLYRSRERIGRIAVTVFWLLGAVLLWLVQPPLPLYVAAHLGMIWLVRALYFHAGVLSALADLGLSGFSLIAGAWAAVQTGSLFMTLWTLLLVQALFVAIPASFRKGVGADETGEDDAFQRAHANAEAALRRLTSIR